MNSRQFLAVIMLFVVIAAYIIYAGKRRRDKEKYELIMNERFRVALSNVQVAGPAEIKKAQDKGAPRGHSWEEMVKVDSLWLLELNGSIDERSGERIPKWIIKAYKKQYNADY